MAVTVRVEGLRELSYALEELPKATQKNTLRRVLRKAAANFDDIASSMAPVLTGELQRSVVTGSQLNKSQKRYAKKETKHFVEIHVGTSDPAGIFQEFGTFKEPSQPFMRPTWDSTKNGMLETIKRELGTEIQKSAARLGRKAAKLAG